MKRQFLAPILMLAACGPAHDPAGKPLYDAYCVACHGASGRGDGVLAADLDVAPADLTLLSQRNGGTFPRDHVMETVFGYPGKYQVAAMPEFGLLLTGPVRVVETGEGAMIPTPVSLIALTDYLQSLQRD